MMEEIKLNLPRFDQCISLLRTEIAELKAGKLDHRLREVAAIPLIDPSLHSALSKAIDDGLLLLPPAPEFSDSDDEQIGDEEDGDATDAKETGDIQVEEEEEEDGAAYADGKGAAAGGGVASGEEQEGEGDNEVQAWKLLGEESQQPGGEQILVGTQRRGHQRSDRNWEGATIPTSGAASSKSKDGTCQRTEGVAEANGLTLSVMKPPEDDTSDSFAAQNEPQVKSNGSPLRDRPPILSGGGSRVAPAAPPPTQPPPSSHRADSGLVGGSEGRIDSDRFDGIEDGSRVEDDRGHGGIDEGKVDTGSEILRVADAAVPSFIQEMESVKYKPGGDDPGGETNGKEATKGKRGRKRPRVAQSASSHTSPRLRRPQPRRQDEIPGTGEGDEDGEAKKDRDRDPDDTDTGKRESARDSVEVEHFRRIALEVWDRVYKHKFAIIFRKPVNPKDAPGYEKVIKKPMDLGLIKQRIISGAIISLDDLSSDLFVMCNNAMVFNGKGDPYFDYSKDLRTFASDIVSEARRPGFVTADPGFDSIVAGTRTSRARQPSPSPAAPAQSAPRGRVKKKRQSGAGSVGGRRSSRESDSASVADDTEDEESKGRQRWDEVGNGANGAKKGGKRLSMASKAKSKKVGGRRGSNNHAGSEVESVGDSIVEVGSDEDDDGDERRKDGGDSASSSKNPSEHGAGRKQAAVGKGKNRAKGVVKSDSSDDDQSSARGKGRKSAKPAARRTKSSKAGASKKRAQ